MHIQLPQSGLLLRNIKIYGICITLEKKCDKKGNQIIRNIVQYLEQTLMLVPRKGKTNIILTPVHVKDLIVEMA